MNTHDFIDLAKQFNEDMGTYPDLFDTVALIEQSGFKIVKDES